MPLRIALSLLLTAAGLIVVEAAGLGARLFPAAGTATRWLVAGGLAGALFLLLLLLLGVRRDPLALLAQRLERFRVRFLEEVAVTPGGLDRGRWRRELQSHKDEVRTQLLAATRRLSRGRRRRAEAMFEAGWQRIVDYLESRAGEAPATLDGAAIERLIEAALAPPATARPSSARPPVSDRLRQAPTPPTAARSAAIRTGGGQAPAGTSSTHPTAAVPAAVGTGSTQPADRGHGAVSPGSTATGAQLGGRRVPGRGHRSAQERGSGGRRISGQAGAVRKRSAGAP